MTLYRVSWEIDVEAESPRDAAEKVHTIQQDRSAIAHVYHVTGYRHSDVDSFIEQGSSVVIDLDEDTES